MHLFSNRQSAHLRAPHEDTKNQALVAAAFYRVTNADQRLLKRVLE
jgi:hypothetical protein